MDKVVHFEIPADNLDRVQKFYSGVFGWKTEKVPMPGAPYIIATTVETEKDGMPKSPGAINGGLMGKDSTAPYPVIVIKVANIDDAMKKVENSGGKIVLPKRPVGNMGLYARFQDPEGNILGLWQDLPKQTG